MAYHCKNGVCYPDDMKQAGIFKGLQRAINNVLDVSAAGPNMYSKEPWPVSVKLSMNIDNVDVDGQIGPATTSSALDLVFNTRLKEVFPKLVAAFNAPFTERAAQADAEVVAADAARIAIALNALVNGKLDTSTAPTWLTVVSPPAAALWSLRAFIERK